MVLLKILNVCEAKHFQAYPPQHTKTEQAKHSRANHATFVNNVEREDVKFLKLYVFAKFKENSYF